MSRGCYRTSLEQSLRPSDDYTLSQFAIATNLKYTNFIINLRLTNSVYHGLAYIYVVRSLINKFCKICATFFYFKFTVINVKTVGSTVINNCLNEKIKTVHMPKLIIGETI